MAALFERADVVLSRHRAHPSCPLPPHPSPSSSSSASRPLETGLPSLDARLAALLLHHPAASALSQAVPTPSQQATRLAQQQQQQARILEIAGPTASGKTAFVVGCAVRERLEALVASWEACGVNEDGREGGAGQTNGKGKGKEREKGRRKLSWAEWDEEVVKSASQVMIIDTEGACTPERLLTAAKSIILSTPHLLDLARVLPQIEPTAGDGYEDDAADVILPLVQAVLEGIQLCRPATRAQFLATIVLIDPHLSNGLRAAKVAPRVSDGQGSGREGEEVGGAGLVSSSPAPAPAPATVAAPVGSPPSTLLPTQATAPARQTAPTVASPSTAAAVQAQSHSSLPPNTSLLLIDSLSAFLRAHPSTKAEREERAHILSALSSLAGRVRRYNQACWNLHHHGTRSSHSLPQSGRSSGRGRMMGMVVSVQMAVKMVPQDGSLANFEVGGAERLPDKVAVLVPQVQIVSSSSSSSTNLDPAATDGRRGGAGGSRGAETYEDPSASVVGSGMNASVLGDEVWRAVLFRAGGGGHRFVQLYQLPRSVEANLANVRVLQQQATQQQERQREGTRTQGGAEEDVLAYKRWIHYVIDPKSGLPQDPPT
ncbi:hypothetical protein OC834_000026 [Tilletia horrida]|nr:hypothetical protein OC834_000026 [Tilletia horrida]